MCSVVISHVPHTFIPIAVASNLWIIPSNPQAIGTAMKIIFLDKATGAVPLQQSFHILRLSPACSVTSRYFHLHPHYEDHSIVMNVSLDTANSHAVNISMLDFRIWKHLTANGPHLTCRNWQMFLKCQSHSSTEMLSMPVNPSTHLQSRMMRSIHQIYRQS